MNVPRLGWGSQAPIEMRPGVFTPLPRAWPPHAAWSVLSPAAPQSIRSFRARLASKARRRWVLKTGAAPPFEARVKMGQRGRD